MHQSALPGFGGLYLVRVDLNIVTVQSIELHWPLHAGGCAEELAAVTSMDARHSGDTDLSLEIGEGQNKWNGGYTKDDLRSMPIGWF